MLVSLEVPVADVHGVHSVPDLFSCDDAYPRVEVPPSELFPPLDAVRRWMGALHDPVRLADPVMVEVVRQLCRLPPGGSRLEVGRAGVCLIREAIGRLEPVGSVGHRERLAYSVLDICFVRGVKAKTAAARLGISARQLTRERTHAIELVRSEVIALLLAKSHGRRRRQRHPAAHRYPFDPIPLRQEFLGQPVMPLTVTDVLACREVVHVHGPAGAGKTSLVAEFAAACAKSEPVLWYRLRAGVNDTLVAVLFELAEHLRQHGQPYLAELTAASLPRVDVSLVSRVAVSELGSLDGLLVFDDYHLAKTDPSIGNFSRGHHYAPDPVAGRHDRSPCEARARNCGSDQGAVADGARAAHDPHCGGCRR